MQTSRGTTDTTSKSIVFREPSGFSIHGADRRDRPGSARRAGASRSERRAGGSRKMLNLWHSSAAKSARRGQSRFSCWSLAVNFGLAAIPRSMSRAWTRPAQNLQANVLRIDVEVRNPSRMQRLDTMECLLEQIDAEPEIKNRAEDCLVGRSTYLPGPAIAVALLRSRVRRAASAPPAAVARLSTTAVHRAGSGPEVRRSGSGSQRD